MFHLLIYSLLFITTSLSAQDSLKLYSVPKWKLDRLLDVYFFDAPTCDTALNKSFQAIDSLKAALTAGETLIELRTQERDLKVAEADTLRKLMGKKDELHKVEVKRERKRGNRKALAGIVAGFILAVVMI